MNPVEIVPYRIQQEGGTFALLLGTQLIMQSTNREDCEKVKTGLEHRGHAQRILASTYYDSTDNTIKDGIEAR